MRRCRIAATWRLGTCLILAMGAGPSIVFAFGALGPYLTADLRLSPLDLGLLATVSSVVAIPVSLGLTRTKRDLTAGLLYGTFVCALVGVVLFAGATGYFMLGLAAAGAGFAQALANPATNGAIANLPPSSNRGLLVGTKQSGVQVLQLLTGILLPIIAFYAGWRTAALAIVVPVLLGLTLVGSAPRFAEIPVTTAKQPPPAVDPHLVRLLSLYTFCMSIPLQATTVYLPLFAHSALGLGEVAAGVTVGIIGAVGTVSRIAWALRAQARPGVASMTLLPAMSAAGALCLFGSAALNLPVVMYAGIILHASSAVACLSLVMVTIVRAVPSSAVAAVTGAVSAATFGGFLVGPVLFGFLIQRFDYRLVWLTSMIIFIVAVVCVQLNRATVRRATTSTSKSSSATALGGFGGG